VKEIKTIKVTVGSHIFAMMKDTCLISSLYGITTQKTAIWVKYSYIL